MSKQSKTPKTDEAGAEAEGSPNELLAVRIAQGLLEADLIEPRAVARLQERLAQGKLNESSWRLAFENRIERQPKPGLGGGKDGGTGEHE